MKSEVLNQEANYSTPLIIKAAVSYLLEQNAKIVVGDKERTCTYQSNQKWLYILLFVTFILLRIIE